MRCAATALAVAASMLALPAAAADEGFDAAAYDRKAFEWTGFVEARAEPQRLRPGSAGHALQYPGEARRRALRLGAAAELSAVLRHQALSVNVTGHVNGVDEPRGSASDYRSYEAYASWQVDAGRSLQVGKRALRWGKGYAWSPVAFLERAKDPSDPELAREGFVMATGAWVRSYDGPLQALSLTAAAVPTTGGLNPDFGGGAGNAGHANPALKLYALVLDTDLDLIWAGRGSRGPRVGFDFSRNLGRQLEVHGEWSRVADAPRAMMVGAGTLQTQAINHTSALIGLRYLSERDTTVIAELYRNGAGYSTDELGAFYALARASSGDPALWPLASRAAASGYARPNAARRYAYFRVSQKEPLDILDFTPSVSLIVNTGDHSWSITPELLFTGIRNLELRARLALNQGAAGTEYGERAVRSRVELRARLYF